MKPNREFVDTHTHTYSQLIFSKEAKVISYRKSTNLNLYFKPYKNNAKWIIDLNISWKECVGKNLCDFEWGKDFLDKTHKNMRDKIDKLGLIKN